MTEISAAATARQYGAEGGEVSPLGTAAHHIAGTPADRAPVPQQGFLDGSSLTSGAASCPATPAFSEGKRSRHSGYRHDWSPEDDAIVRLMVEGTISTAEAARRVGVSAVSIRYRATRLGLSKAPLPALKGHEELPERLTPAHGWVPIAHKADRKWRLFDGAPVTVEEAQRMRDAGIATTTLIRVDGGVDLLVALL